MEAVAEVKQKRKLDELSFDELAAVRNRLGEQIAEADAVVSALKARREKVDVALLAKFNQQGSTSVKTKHGTPYIIHRTSISVSDGDAFLAWAEADERWKVFIDRRPNKTAVETYREANGELPPGLNRSVTAAIGLKKS
jgi:hypothetical protein